MPQQKQQHVRDFQPSQHLARDECDDDEEEEEEEGVDGNSAEVEDEFDSDNPRRTSHKPPRWFPRLTRSAIDCFRRSSNKSKSTHRSPVVEQLSSSSGGVGGGSRSKIEESSAEMYYNALQSELRISNPYLYDGRETPNREIYRQSWKLDPFPALPPTAATSAARRRCRSETNVARRSLLISPPNVQRCPLVTTMSSGKDTDESARKKSINWLRESKIKLEELFRRKCRFLTQRKRASSLSDVHKFRVEGGGGGLLGGGASNFNTMHSFKHTAPNERSMPISPPSNSASNRGSYCCPIDYGDHTLFNPTAYPPNCDPNEWRQKLETWAASLQCAIQVIKREENLRMEINQLRMHRELLERQLEEISAEKERWRRKCIELQKEKRRSMDGVTCQHCGGLVYPYGEEETRVPLDLDPLTRMTALPPLSLADDAFKYQNRRNRIADDDDDIFNALHDLILHYT